MERFLSSLSKEDYEKRISGFPLGVGEVTDISNFAISSFGRFSLDHRAKYRGRWGIYGSIRWDYGSISEENF